MDPTSYPTSSPTDQNSLIGGVGVAVVLFVIFGIVIGAITDYALHALSFPIPYVAFVFFEGVGIAVLLKYLVAGDAIDQVESTKIASIMILFVFLPILLFGEVMNLNWHHIKGGFNQSLILAGPCALFSALLTAVFTQLVWPSWNQPVLYFVFGAILCATDPVSVVALLKSTGASSKLTIVIVGESLMNDGTAMILFFYFLGTLDGTSYTAGQFFEFVSIKLLASPGSGLLIGLLSVFLMKRLYQTWHIPDMSLQVAISLTAAYASFFVAQWPTLIDGSGVLSCCSAGLVVAWLSSPKILADHLMHEVWGRLEWVCNTLIFLLGGLVAGGGTLDNATYKQAGYSVLIYVILMLIRVVIVAFVYPLVSRIGLKCSLNDAIFMSFSGIRGALAIALALELKADDNVSKTDGEQFYFFICAVAALSLFINGTLAEPLLQYLRLIDDPTKPKSQDLIFVLEQVKRRIRRTVREELDSMREELGDFDNDAVRGLCRMMRGSIVGEDNYQVASRSTSKISPDLLAYVRTTFLETVRSRYWDSIMTGKIGTQSFSGQLLLYSVDKAKDLVNDPTMSLGDWECIERNLDPDPTIMRVASAIDWACRRIGVYSGLVSYIDAYTERRAIYVLTNFIDAHVYAQNRLHMFLGAPGKEYGEVIPEEVSVNSDSERSVARAKYLLRLIKSEDLTSFFNHRAARVVLILQQQMIEHMVQEGALSDKLAKAFIASIDEDHQDLDVKREKTHRSFLKETQKRKVDEEKERYSNETLRTSLLETQEKGGRTSFALAPTASASAAAFPRTPSLRESLSGVDRPILDYNESFVGDAAVTMAAIKR